jgi:ELWxxDGT repeat protein
MLAFQNQLFFSGFEHELASKGPGGVGQFKDIAAGAAGSYPEDLRAHPNGTQFLFTADDQIHGRELWVSDGTQAGTVLLLDIHPGSIGSNPRGIVPFGGKLYFSADDGIHGRELWVSDGTVAGTQLVSDSFAGQIVTDTNLFFGADNGSNQKASTSTVSPSPKASCSSGLRARRAA